MKHSLSALFYFLVLSVANAQFQAKYDGGWSEQSEDIDFFKKGTISTGLSVGSPMSAFAMVVGDDGKLGWANKYFVSNNGVNSITFFEDVLAFRTRTEHRIAVTGGTSFLTSSNGKTDILFSILSNKGIPLTSSIIGTAEYDKGLVVKKIDHPKYGPGFIIIGESHPSPNPNFNWNLTVSILDDKGKLMESAEYDASGRQEIHDVVQTKEGFILVGRTTPSGPVCDGSNMTALILSLNNNLQLQWNKIIDIVPEGQTSNDEAVGVSIYKDKLWVAGNRNNNSNYVPASFLLEMDLSGNISWLKEYNVTLAKASGQRISANGDLENIIMTLQGVFATDHMGNPLWYKYYTGNLPFLWDMAISEDYEGLALCGRDASSTPYTKQDIFLIRTKHKGESDPNCEIDLPIVQSKPDYCEKQISIGLIGTLNQKKAKVVSVKFPLTAYDCQYNLVQSSQGESGVLYPNPARDHIHLDGESEIKKASIQSIAGLDVIDVIVKDQKIDISRLPKGIYVLHLTKMDGSVVNHTFRKE
ncbi:T9SS type A sorting domain-containing protein [Ekhidna sp.]